MINRKKTKGKVPMNLLPAEGRIQGALAMAEGARIYGAYQWREAKIVSLMEYLDAIERHLTALLEGEDNAPDSGIHHAGHIVADASLILDARKHGNLIDDRPHIIRRRRSRRR